MQFRTYLRACGFRGFVSKKNNKHLLGKNVEEVGLRQPPVLVLEMPQDHLDNFISEFS